MSSEFGLRGPKTPWVCPNDRQLALRAKLKTGWSIKTNQFTTYPKPAPLSEKEQQAIVQVIKKAEELELNEQHRVGKLVDRLESLKKLASGNGVTECILCGDSFGLSVFGRTNYKCDDCKKQVCRKCVVELTTNKAGSKNSGSADSLVHLCKLCSENREFLKKSGAWFYKGVPTYILPQKKSMYNNCYESNSSRYPEHRYMSRYINYQSQNLPSTSKTSSSESSNPKKSGLFWSRTLIQKEPTPTPKSTTSCDHDNESSSEEDDNDEPSPKVVVAPGVSKSVWKTTTTPGNSSDPTTTSKRSSSSRRRLNNSSQKSSSQQQSSHHNTTVDSVILQQQTNNHSSLLRLSSSSFEQQQQQVEGQKSLEKSSPSDTLSSGDNNKQPRASTGSTDCGSSTATTSGSSLSTNTANGSSCSGNSAGIAPHGVLELSLLHDESHQALHCTVHKAKELVPADVHQLSDPYCVLKLVSTRFDGTELRTKTVHKTIHPVFNETLTFYGITQTDLAWTSLQIHVMDEDVWGKECLGVVQIPLHKLRPQQTRFFSLPLEEGNLVDDLEWGRGRLLLSVCYMSDKNILVVGVVRAQDLPALDHNGTSDPFVKVRLLHDSCLGAPTSSVNQFSINRKFKTSVKWRTLNPEFDEEFTYKVSKTDLSRLALAISVWDRDIGRNNDYIGGTLLSASSKGVRLKQWSDMMRTPNTKHYRWHTLSPASPPHH